MRDYGRVHTAFWTSQDVQGLSDDGKLLALYLLTSPHTTIIGAFRMPDGYVCEDIKWTAQRVAKGLAELLSKGFANRCGTTKWVWICKFLTWNRPENPNQWKAARKQVDQIPDECDWKQAFMRSLALMDDDSEPPEDNPLPNPSETLPKPGTGTGTGTGKGARKRARASPSKTFPFPDDFVLSGSLTAYAVERLPDVNAAALFEQFRENCKAKNRCYADWPAAWRTWVGNCVPGSGSFADGKYPKANGSGRWV